ncbi:hypothetical protein [Halorubellus salinus]|uniref:hypothetical protein n=1 Tax=Halorubellus salinus TaxID=755309 RepID=UPI001D062BDC|nr:hypothetical protein [Halorubellus salinus]
MSVFGEYRVGGSVQALAGYVLLSAGSVVFLYAAPFTAAFLWYRCYDWYGSDEDRGAVATTTLAVLALAMTAYAALVVTGLPVDSGFQAVAVE